MIDVTHSSRYLYIGGNTAMLTGARVQTPFDRRRGTLHASIIGASPPPAGALAVPSAVLGDRENELSPMRQSHPSIYSGTASPLTS